MKKLVKFNVQNPAYALQTAEGWGSPKSNGDARTIALEANASQKTIYGNGVITCSIINDKGKTGTLTVNTVPDEYEIDMGRKIKTAVGLAEIKQTSEVLYCQYFETCEIIKTAAGKTKKSVAKTWAYGVSSTRPAENFNQDEDDINESAFDIPLAIRGIPLLNADKTPYVMDGMEVLAWSLTVTPEDANYLTFGDAVVLPIMPAIEPVKVGA